MTRKTQEISKKYITKQTITCPKSATKTQKQVRVTVSTSFELYMFYMKVNIKGKRTKRKVSITLSLLSNHKVFEGCYVSDVTNSLHHKKEKYC